MLEILQKNMDRGRVEDLKELEHMLKQTEPGTKQWYRIREVMRNISYQNKYIRDMREALLRAVRHNDVDEIKDIGEYVKKKSHYQSGSTL